MPVSPKTYQPQPAILELGPEFFDAVEPAHFPEGKLRFFNETWAKCVGLESLTAEERKNHFWKFAPLPGNLEKPLALRYHGHQFRHYNPDLGDGRGFLFAQLKDDRGRLLDLGTKGSGQTPYSRRGDGRLTLKGAVREVLATETLEALGVNTSKTFAVFETGENLERNDEPSPTRSAVLTRLNHSHIRFGTFQRLMTLKKNEEIPKLVSYCLRHYLPEADASTPETIRFLSAVTVRAARLAAQWIVSGFVHGVLNTDNMNITGESFDYGPYRFLPQYDPSFTAAYFDQSGLYAYGRQPETVLWNLERLADTLLPFAEREELISALELFAPAFNKQAVAQMSEQLGLAPSEDESLLLAVFEFLAASQIEYPQFFFDWYGGNLSRERAKKSPAAEKYQGSEFEAFLKAIENREPNENAKKQIGSAYFAQTKPCSMLIDEIEWIWSAIAVEDDWSRFENKLKEIKEMKAAYGRN
ncbi:MAG TPA: YdiU family protein [Bdellovibrionales bacterium]|nr:YdiU family protein [Bdellovibrionales bacterium]